MPRTSTLSHRFVAPALLAAALMGSTVAATTARAQTTPVAQATIDTTADAGDADAVEPRRRLVKWNEYDGPVSTFRFGYGFLVDLAGYDQDEEAKQQVKAEPDMGLRDSRLLFKGRFKTHRPMSWTLGYMYDGADKSWRFRQTGIQVGFPEAKGRLFVGRTKEGYSMIKVMVGYHGIGIERSQAEDAFVPILADGAKWMEYLDKQLVFGSFGWYTDKLGESEKFMTYNDVYSSRVGWQPILSEEQHAVLHVAVMSRDGHVDDGKYQVRSRPGSYLAPYFLDTGKFAAGFARTRGVEAFYRKGPWLYGGEYNWQRVNAATGEQPMFHGGNFTVAWIITGETRPYDAPGGFFTAVSPKHSVFDGGFGAWEAVLDYSYADFNDGVSFQGGKYWRLTPMVNWHMSDNLRLEFVYGHGVLDRFGLKGTTQFFQARFQTSL
jgi:phosphate-selective porin OprO/OprP